MRRSHSLALLVLIGVAGCAGKRTAGTPDNEPTLKTLAGREVKLDKDPGIQASEEQAIAAYRKFLEIAPKAPQRSEAMRRLGDLEMDSADNKSVTDASSNGPDYKAAIARYQEYLKTYPKDPGNDRVSRAYQVRLRAAQHSRDEGSGRLRPNGDEQRLLAAAPYPLC